MTRRAFPPGFLWGAATAAFEIEGALNADGRGPSIWDRFMREPGKIVDGSDAAVANDHYHRWREDVALLRELGLRAYRFSVAWPRVIPDGSGQVNTSGLDFYDRLVDALFEAGVEPMLTLYHWDLPQPLEDAGGWTNRATVEHFQRYARVVAERLGDRVRLWATHNEPWIAAFPGYGLGRMAPGRSNWGDAVGAAHHLLLSHASAAATIRQHVCHTVAVGIVLNLSPSYAWSDHESDVAAASRFDGYLNRWFLDPLFGRGYPQDMLALYGDDQPPVLAGDLERIAASTDFLGVNYYLRTNVRNAPGEGKLNLEVPGPRPGAERNEIGWEIFPEGLYEVLMRLHREYRVSRIFITENGFPDPLRADETTNFDDVARISYLHRHITQMHRAMADGVPVEGYFCWSLTDNWEWEWGYTARMGLVRVERPSLRRRIKASGGWYRDLIARGALPEETSAA